MARDRAERFRPRLGPRVRGNRILRRVRLSGLVLLNGNAPRIRMLEDDELARRPDYVRMPLPPGVPNLTNAVASVDYYDLSRRVLREAGVERGTMAEIGASLGGNGRAAFPEFDYVNLDIEPQTDLPTRVVDICGDPFDEPGEQFDFVFSRMAFEHFARPWVAARNIAHLLRPGGIAVTATVFAWRYHPVPEDYWRFSPAALREIFCELETLETGFVSQKRRAVASGRYPNLSDAVPVDEHGGWLESWEVFHAGRKPTDG